MKKVLLFLMLLCCSIFYSQKLNSLRTNSDSTQEKVIEIEEVKINPNDYKKITHSFGLKKTMNSRFIVFPNYQIAVKMLNPHQARGLVSEITLFLHKTEKGLENTDLAINFYTINQKTGKPDQKINKEEIIYLATSINRRRKLDINVEDQHIPFPSEGLFVAVKWLVKNNNKNKKVGPSIRLTKATDQKLTYTQYLNRGWGLKSGQNPNTKSFINAMMGIKVYFKKKKNE